MRIIFLLFLLSCSSQKTDQEPMVGVPNDITVVEDSHVVIQDTEQPTPPQESEIKTYVPSKTSVGLIFGPGLNRTVGYSVFLKALKKQNINIEMVSGTGMGAIVAALLASGKTPQKIEWLFFKFFNETKGRKPYSGVWRRSLKKVFLEEFKNTKMEDLRIPLMIPVFQNNPPLIKNVSSGNLFDLLNAQFNFSLKEEGPYSSPLGKVAFDGFWMKNLGTKIVIGVDVIGNKVVFEEETEFLKQLYGKVLKNIRSGKVDLDFFFTLPFSQMPLDSEKKLPESLQKTADYSKWAGRSVKIKRDEIKANEEDQ